MCRNFHLIDAFKKNQHYLPSFYLHFFLSTSTTCNQKTYIQSESRTQSFAPDDTYLECIFRRYFSKRFQNSPYTNDPNFISAWIHPHFLIILSGTHLMGMLVWLCSKTNFAFQLLTNERKKNKVLYPEMFWVQLFIIHLCFTMQSSEANSIWLFHSCTKFEPVLLLFRTYDCSFVVHVTTWSGRFVSVVSSLVVTKRVSSSFYQNIRKVYKFSTQQMDYELALCLFR